MLRYIDKLLLGTAMLALLMPASDGFAQARADATIPVEYSGIRSFSDRGNYLLDWYIYNDDGGGTSDGLLRAGDTYIGSALTPMPQTLISLPARETVQPAAISGFCDGTIMSTAAEIAILAIFT